MIAVENTPTRASAFNLSDPAVVVNERAVTSRHRNEEYSSNPHPVSGSNLFLWLLLTRTVGRLGTAKLSVERTFAAVGWGGEHL